MKLIKNNLLKIAIRIFVGIVFVISAILKITSIDSFEVYIFSFGLLKLNTAFFFARIIISFEMFLGLLLILGSHSKKVITISLLMLLLFSGFISVLLINNNTEHCHCFGDIIELSHTISIVKNLVLILLLAVIYKLPKTKIQFEKLVLIAILALSFSLPFILSPPDSFSFDYYAEQTSYNQEMLDEYIVDRNYATGKEILCFYGATCRFCKLAAKKIYVITEKANNIESPNYIFLGSDDEIDNFFKETNTPVFSYSTMSPGLFLRITDGQMPLILLLENGIVKKKYSYRDINENEIIDFLQNVD